MTSLKEEAENYKPTTIKNVADLEYVDISMQVLSENECEFPYKYILSNGERYKINNSVIADINGLLLNSPGFTKFKIVKKGEGMKTKYQTIPIQ